MLGRKAGCEGVRTDFTASLAPSRHRPTTVYASVLFTGSSLQPPRGDEVGAANKKKSLPNTHGVRICSAPMRPGRDPECGPISSALAVGGPLVVHAAKCCVSGGQVCRSIHPPPGGRGGHCLAPCRPPLGGKARPCLAPSPLGGKTRPCLAPSPALCACASGGRACHPPRPMASAPSRSNALAVEYRMDCQGPNSKERDR